MMGKSKFVFRALRIYLRVLLPDAYSLAVITTCFDLNRLAPFLTKLIFMHASFAQNEADHYHRKIAVLEIAYNKAIQGDQEFSEAKKIFEELKKTKKKLRLIIEKDPELQRKFYDSLNRSADELPGMG
jgi:hypothetical protein